MIDAKTISTEVERLFASLEFTREPAGLYDPLRYMISIGGKRLRPTLVSMYSYLQPILATAISIWIGLDTLTWQKLLATILIVGGVILVSRSRARS
ncbi:MAG: EamA family transporter [Bacteroidales bacterium]|nr:EamA family transporter [Bacteroidales bacterium]